MSNRKYPVDLASVILLTLFLFSARAQPPKEIWKFKASGIIVSAPVYDGQDIFIGSHDSTYYSLALHTGQVRWKFKTEGQIGSTAAINGDKIYFFSSDTRLYCLNKSNGKPVWQFKTFSGALPDRRYDWPDYYQSSPTIDNNVVYFGAGDGRVYAVDAQHGKLIWSYQTGDVVHSKPAVHGQKLVIGSFDGHMYCLDKGSGSLIWQFKTTGHRYFPKGEINGNPVIHRDKVIFGARDYNLYAVDLEGGYCHWMKTFPQGWALPVTANDSVLYVGTSDDRMLLALDEETGQIRWKTNLGFNNFAAIAISNNLGYTGTLNGKLFCIDLNAGDIRWTFLTDTYKKFRSRYFQNDEDRFVDNIGQILPNGDAILKMYERLGAIFSQPLVVGQKVVFASNDGTVYCLQL